MRRDQRGLIRRISLRLGVALTSMLCLPVSAQTYSKIEKTVYHDDLGQWVLGQTKSISVNGDTALRFEYEWGAKPTKIYSVGDKLEQAITYNPDGTVATVRDANGNTISASQWKRGVPKRIDLADGTYLTADVDDNGWLTWTEDEARSRTCFSYDGLGRLVTTTFTSESATNTCNTSTWEKTTQSFAPSAVARYGLPAGYWIQIVDTGKGRKVRHFDALWRPVLEEQFDNTDNPTALATRSMVVKRYDAEGRLEFQSYPVASITSIDEAALKGVWTEHDGLGRVTSSSQDSELGLLTTLTQYISRFQTRVVSPKGQVTHYEYQTFDVPSTDAVTAVTRFAGADTTVNQILRNVYGKPTLILQRNANGSVRVDRTYTYNARQELCRTVEPESGATLMGYDLAGNLSWSAAGLPSGTACDATGTSAAVVARKAARTYDARNRLSTLSFPDGLGNQLWTYTANGKPSVLTAYNAASNGEPVTSAYTYNRRGFLTLERLVNSMLDWPYEYKYNANGHLASNNWHGIVVAYAPNQLGQPTQAGPYATNVQYFPNGAVKQFTYGNGIVHTLTQNGRQFPARSVDGSVLDMAYVYDKHANVTSITDSTTGARQSRTMTYDSLDRLLTANGASFGTANYGYNVLDDITRLTVTGGSNPRDHVYHYDATTRRLGSVSNWVDGATVVGLSYDLQGNLDNKNGLEHNFDYGNRLREVVGKGTYLYDAHGRRVRDTVNGVAAHSQYLMNGQLAFSTDSRTGKVREHIYLGSNAVAIRERDAPTNVYTYRYLHTDGLGSVLLETDATQMVLERSEYEPFGLLTNRAEKDEPGFTGHRQDASTGLTYMQQRYYDPQLGVFLSVDPLTAYDRPVAGFNRYRYAADNPYKFIDPDGRCERTTGSRICGGGAENNVSVMQVNPSSGGMGGGGRTSSQSTNGNSSPVTSTAASSSNDTSGSSDSDIQDFGQMVVVGYRGEFHDQVVKQMAGFLRAGGANVLTEVKMCFEGTCARIDIFGRDPIGRLFAIEVKTGLRPDFTLEQLAVYPHLRSGFLVTAPDGKVSQLGLSPGVPLGPVEGLLWYQRDAQTPGFAVPFP